MPDFKFTVTADNLEDALDKIGEDPALYLDEDQIENATYVSEWDNGTTVRSPCKFDICNLRCFDIQQSETDVGNAQLLEEYVETEDNSYHETEGVTFDY